MSFTDLDAWLSARTVADRFCGVVLIRRGDQTVFSGAYGWASRRWAVSNTLSTRFDTASITKLFTSVAAPQLVDEGRLNLDKPITEIVDLTGTTISPKVTVRRLLARTSGIADDADEEAGESYEALWIDNPVYSVMRTRIISRTSLTSHRIFRRARGADTATPGISSSAWRSRRSPEPITATISAAPFSPARA
jgi:CubicO group peptidase (beta-lactamase class C family)